MTFNFLTINEPFFQVNFEELFYKLFQAVIDDCFITYVVIQYAVVDVHWVFTLKREGFCGHLKQEDSERPPVTFHSVAIGVPVY